jgi:hypothetical protein
MSPCQTFAGAIICQQPYVRTARHCATCGRVRPMAGTYGHWYGASLTCLGCGDHYEDECWPQRSPRPFCRGWQTDAINEAHFMWTRANPLRMEMRRQDADWNTEEADA